MKGWLLFLVLVLMAQLAIGVRINEVEGNPGFSTQSDIGREYVELYSESEINLTNWRLVNEDNDTRNLNETFSGYLIINFSKQWVDDDNETYILLIDNLGIIRSNFSSFYDKDNDNKTWQYCDELGWIFANGTKGLQNNCQIAQGNNNQTNSTQNNTNNTLSNQTNTIINNTNSTQTQNNTNNTLIFKIDFSQGIRNGQEAELSVEISNLEDYYYDIKVIITDGSQPIGKGVGPALEAIDILL